jgi:hypothetical protein
MLNDNSSGVDASHQASSDTQTLLARAESESINPDILTHTRRWSDPGRQWMPNQTEQWDTESTEHFFEWINERCMNLEMQIMYLQKEQNGIALKVLQIESEVFAKDYKAAWPVEGTLDLMAQWNELDNQIRFLKHRERLLAQPYFLATTHTYELPERDPLFMALRDMAIMGNFRDRPYKPARTPDEDKGVAA